MVEYQIVTLVVVGSSPTTYPVWVKIFFRKNLSNKNQTKIKNLFEICINAQLYKNKEFFLNNNKVDDESKSEKKIDIELNIVETINSRSIDNVSNTFMKVKNVSKYNLWNTNYTQKLSNLYNKYVGVELRKKKKVDQLVFDLKRKQLYSIWYKNMTVKKLITNGGILKELQIFVKKQKKNISVYSFNVKKILGLVTNKDYMLEIIGCKNQMFKVIKFIKKYYKRNCIFIFTPKRSFFKNQFKKLSSIKRKMTKKYNKSLSLG